MANIIETFVVVECDDGKFYQVAVPSRDSWMVLSLVNQVVGSPVPVHPHELLLERTQ